MNSNNANQQIAFITKLYGPATSSNPTSWNTSKFCFNGKPVPFTSITVYNRLYCPVEMTFPSTFTTSLEKLRQLILFMTNNQSNLYNNGGVLTAQGQTFYNCLNVAAVGFQFLEGSYNFTNMEVIRYLVTTPEYNPQLYNTLYNIVKPPPNGCGQERFIPSFQRNTGYVLNWNQNSRDFYGMYDYD